MAILQTPNFCGNMRTFGYRDNRGRLGSCLNDTFALSGLLKPLWYNYLAHISYQAELEPILCSNTQIFVKRKFH